MSLKSVVQLLQHILIVALLFCAIAAVAMFLWYATVLMEKYGLPDEIRVVCYWLSKGLFGLDAFCTVVYGLAETYKWLKAIIRDARSG